MTHLFLFQIGPVQAFIAQARRTQDLFIGSRILSELASAGVSKAARECRNFKDIFPVLQNGQVSSGAPHRFAFLCDDEPNRVAQIVREGIEQCWQKDFVLPVRNLVQDALDEGEWTAIFDRQASSWMEFYWVAVPYDNKDHGASFKKASAAMAQRKYARVFHPIDEPGYKCTLTGMQSALMQGTPKQNEANWEKLRKRLNDTTERKIIRDNENLGALALIKRLAAIALEEEARPMEGFKGFPSTNSIAQDSLKVTEENTIGKDVNRYIAILHMDGDRMGRRLAELTTLQEHQEFSRQLEDFATNEVKRIIKAFGGQTGRLVYSGGDDVLALLPLKHALSCANELHKRFQEMTNCTTSAGIAITPADLPLDRGLELAREAEELAKEKYGRDAIVIIEAHSSGQMREAGGKWDIIGPMAELQTHFQEGRLSGKLGYDLLSINHYLYGDALVNARKLEIHRIAKRRTDEDYKSEYEKEIAPIIDQIIALVEDKKVVPTWADMSNWVVLTRFLAQGVKKASVNKAEQQERTES